MYLVSHTLESIRQMDSGDNFTTDISDRLHVANVKVSYKSSNKVIYNRQKFKYNDQNTSLDYVQETLSYLALQGWYNVDSSNVFKILSTTDKQRSSRRAHLLRLQTIQDEPIIRPVSQQVYHFRVTHDYGVYRSIKLTSLRDALDDFGIPNFRQLFCAQIEEDWGPEVCGLILRYDQNVLIDNILIQLQNWLLYYRQPFCNHTSVECLGLDCNIEYTNANQGIMRKAHNIGVQCTQNEVNDLNNPFHRRIPSCSVLYFACTPPNAILQCQERLPAGKALSTFSNRCKKPNNGYYVLKLKNTR